MAITMTGSGGLFTRVGQLGGALNGLNTYRGTTLVADILTAIAEVDGGAFLLRNTIVPQLMAAVENGQSSLGAVASVLKQAAQALLIKMVDDDNPLPTLDVPTALVELRRQMLVGGYYITPNTLGQTVTQTNLTGSCTVLSTILDREEKQAQNLIAQDIEFRVIAADTAGSEVVQLSAEEGTEDLLSHLWPGGSNQTRTVTAIDAASTTLNYLENGGLEDWTGANLDDWTITVGAYGTQIVKETTTKYKGSNGVALVGDGATLTSIEQDITTRVEAFTHVAWNVFMRRDGTAAAAGTLRIELVDGSGTVINDESGNPISQDYDLTALTTSFAAKGRSTALPRTLPTTVKFRMRLTVALTAGRTVYFDHVAMGRMEPAFNRPGWEPYVAIFSGTPELTLNDWTQVDAAGVSRTFKLAVTNNRTSAWCNLVDKFWDTSLYELTLPFSGATLINDALIA